MGPNNHEQGPRGPEHKVEVENAKELREKLANDAERRAERPVESAEKRAEQARFEANKNALETDRSRAEHKTKSKETAPTGRVTKRAKDQAYDQTMKAVRSEMRAPSRTFSKVIHNPVIEKTSDVVGSTIARPNAILAGSLTALIVTSAIYIIANRMGYVLSGFETIGAFIIGWVIGVIIDYARVAFLGKRA